MRSKVEEESKVVLAASERILCRSERLSDLSRSGGESFREVSTTRWIMAGCRTCGLCADMVTT